jgi:hypothetical protein
MTPAQLKTEIERHNPDSKFFSRVNMKAAGDTMANYGVSGPVEIETVTGEMVTVWELYRKNPVKQGLQKSAYFRADTFQQTWKSRK